MLLVCVAMVLFALLSGLGVWILITPNKADKRIILGEVYLLGQICSLGIFEVAHLIGIFANRKVSECGNIVLLFACAMTLFFVGVLIVKRNAITPLSEKRISGTVIVPGIIFLLLLAVQLGYVLSMPMLFSPGDIMQETVCSFLAEDRIYSVSPLTGKVYGGAPLRYKILCLPTVYALLCRWTSVKPDVVIDQMIPCFVVLASYMSYYLLSGVLFGDGEDKEEKRLWFMVMVAVIFFLCEKNTYMEGYGILHAAHMGTTMRNSILIPLVLYASLEKKWVLALACILAEICIVWTFWGLGVCVVITVGVFVMSMLYHNQSVKRLFHRRICGEGND